MGSQWEEGKWYDYLGTDRSRGWLVERQRYTNDRESNIIMPCNSELYTIPLPRSLNGQYSWIWCLLHAFTITASQEDARMAAPICYIRGSLQAQNSFSLFLTLFKDWWRSDAPVFRIAANPIAGRAILAGGQPQQLIGCTLTWLNVWRHHALPRPWGGKEDFLWGLKIKMIYPHDGWCFVIFMATKERRRIILYNTIQYNPWCHDAMMPTQRSVDNQQHEYETWDSRCCW